ncbi:MAG: aspartyl-tRNA(Asn)/glutamyl-tRNA(Gln) amidotransferase subunit [Thermosediminibacterales bacterium]|nr:aspartyl-tRNA(Asn)/glutamyl-tRNA(Gln) amidotransferase subunit [Thermosediminibacterales bacterium]MDK2836436.1 aspartyl-tRNA(Asn)/glutamyl-tRNA(Gln) amidotransferase subunit [Thermosediminibacterales bacterium]
MKISKKDVEHVANLARLHLDEQEKENYTKQLNSILEYMEKLNLLDTEDVPPTSHVIPLKNVFREDKVRDSLSNEEVLANAPDAEDGYFKVPKIIE